VEKGEWKLKIAYPTSPKRAGLSGAAMALSILPVG